MTKRCDTRPGPVGSGLCGTPVFRVQLFVVVVRNEPLFFSFVLLKIIFLFSVFLGRLFDVPCLACVRMMEENPRLLCLVERSVMKHLALELTNLPV